jgi:hypothetical protein
LARPADEITLFDTRTLQALRKQDETGALNAVQRPGIWVAVGLGTVYGLFIANEVVDAVDESVDSTLECFFAILFGGCNDDD